MPVSEDEGEKLIKDPKLMAGIDKIPDQIVYKCMKLVKKPLPDFNGIKVCFLTE